MKYIITSKNITSGNVSVTDPLLRTELCTELIGTRMRALKLLESGQISKYDCIVTRRDRFCLYENIFEHTMDWDSFREPDSDNMVIDLVSEINNGDIDTVENYMKAFYPIPKHIFEINTWRLSHFNPIKIGKPFVVVLKRNNPNGVDKNLPNYIYDNIIEEFSRKYHVFIFGENNNEYSKNATYIESLQDFCYLIGLKNCKHLIAPCTGGVYPVFFCGHKDICLTIIDPNNYCIKHEYSPSFYNNVINFMGIKIVKYFSIENLFNNGKI